MRIRLPVRRAYHTPARAWQGGTHGSEVRRMRWVARRLPFCCRVTANAMDMDVNGCLPDGLTHGHGDTDRSRGLERS
jgi:hypothetical protein